MKAGEMVMGRMGLSKLKSAAKKSADKIDGEILIEDILKFIFLYFDDVKKKEGRETSPFLINCNYLNL